LPIILPRPVRHATANAKPPLGADKAAAEEGCPCGGSGGDDGEEKSSDLLFISTDRGTTRQKLSAACVLTAVARGTVRTGKVRKKKGYEWPEASCGT